MIRFSLLLLGVRLFAQPLLIEHATVVDATGAPPRKNVSVLIDQGRIASIAAKIPRPPGATVVNGKGKFLIPGLWDMHVHIADPDKFFRPLLAAGITGVREMYTGIPANVAAQWRARPDAPWLALPGFVDGPLLGVPPPGAAVVAAPDDARVAVQLHAQSGADFLKVYNSVPRDAYFALVEAAKLIGMPVVGHVPEEVSPREAALAGQRSQEHLLNVLLACSSREAELRQERLAIMTSPALSAVARARLLGFPNAKALSESYDGAKADGLFRVFAESGTWHTPTLALLKGFAQAKDHALLADLSPDAAAAFTADIRALLDRHKALVREMHKAGVQFLAGTDVSATNPVAIGTGLHEELALFVEAGLSPLEALQTATRNPAQYFGRLDRIGTVEVGKVADLVLLDADPLKDIRNVGKIRAVVQKGKLSFSR